MFNHPAYIVFDIEGAMAEEVKKLRKKFDPERSSLHVEISLSGSCGLGAISSNQNPQEVFAAIDKISLSIPPFFNQFDEVKRFSNTGIYYLTLQNLAPFKHSYELLKKSPIKFDECRYPFEPHCTIKLPSLQQTQIDSQIEQLSPPKDKFLIEFISVYSRTSRFGYRLLHKRHLGI